MQISGGFWINFFPRVYHSEREKSCFLVFSSWSGQGFRVWRKTTQNSRCPAYMCMPSGLVSGSTHLTLIFVSRMAYINIRQVCRINFWWVWFKKYIMDFKKISIAKFYTVLYWVYRLFTIRLHVYIELYRERVQTVTTLHSHVISLYKELSFVVKFDNKTGDFNRMKSCCFVFDCIHRE